MVIQDPLSFLGESFSFQEPREEILKNLKLIIRIRWFVSPSIFIIIIIAGAFGLTKESFLSENQLIVNAVNLGVILVMNLIYMALVRRVQNLGPLVFFQLIIDVIHFSLTVYKTGGITSPFTFLYFIVIYSGAILVAGKTAYIIAGLSSLLFTGITILVNRGLLPTQDFFSPFTGFQENRSYITLTWIFTIFSFFIFAALSSYLTNLLHKKQRNLKDANRVLSKKNSTMLLLYRTGEALNTCTTVHMAVDYILTRLVENMILDRAILYLNIKDEYLQLYMAKTRDPGAVGSGEAAGETKSAGGGNDDGAGSPEPAVKMQLRPDAGLTARAAVLKEAYNIRDQQDSPFINRELAEKIGTNPFALAPLLLRDKVIGVIGIDRSFKNGAISEEEFQILKIFANTAAVTIDSVMKIDAAFRQRFGL